MKLYIKALLVVTISFSLTGSPIDLGPIVADRELDFEVPPLNKTIEYTFTPTTRVLAGKKITLILKHEIRTLPHGRAELLNMLVQEGTAKPVVIAAFSVNSKRKHFSDMIHDAVFIIEPDGKFSIKHQLPPAQEINIVGKLIKHSKV
jgi:hypothetical protein